MYKEEEEISYFTNYDMYLDPPDHEPDDWPLPPTHLPLEHHEDVPIELSPYDNTKSPATPSLTDSAPAIKPVACVERSNTSIRRPVYSAPLLHNDAPPCGQLYPNPVEIAKVGISVPHWLIGAIG